MVIMGFSHHSWADIPETEADEKERKSRGVHNEIDLDNINLNAQPPAEEPARQYYIMAKSINKLVLAWNPDFTKLTLTEKKNWKMLMLKSGMVKPFLMRK